MKEISADQIIQQMRILKAQAEGQSVGQIDNGQGAQFANALKGAVDSVNDMQSTAGQLKTSFELGDKSVSLAEVMVASQKANIAFQATVQVRNKFIEAYKDVMNMPV